jgi:CheY-like chemotaxis protein
MDIEMPGMDGFTACRAIKKLPLGYDIPVLMMTGPDDLGSIRRAFDAGAADIIAKPVHWGLLGHRVRHALGAQAKECTCADDT